jgi:hypothetical protein
MNRVRAASRSRSVSFAQRLVRAASRREEKRREEKRKEKKRKEEKKEKLMSGHLMAPKGVVAMCCNWYAYPVFDAGARCELGKFSLLICL